MEDYELCNFIRERYPHWLEYSQFHCAKLQIPEEAMDLLDYVLCVVWFNYDHTILIDFMHFETEKGTRLDFYVMGIIKRNLYSVTAPYIRRLKKDKERFVHVELFSPDVLVYDPADLSSDEIRQEQFDWVMETLERCDFTNYERSMFKYHFVEGKNLRDWGGPESLPTRYRVLQRMINLIKKEKEKMIEMRKF